MKDAWKCSLIQGDICSDSDCLTINHDNVPKLNMKFRIEDEGKNKGLCTNPSVMFNASDSTHSNSYVGDGIDNIFNWDIDKLLDLQIIEGETHNKSEYFSSYIYPYNEELFNANPTCQLKPYENKYKYKTNIVKYEKINVPQYHIDVSNFGVIPDKLLKIIDSSYNKQSQ
jgi:hypothetical protein